MYRDNFTPIYIGSKVVGKVQGDVFIKFIHGTKHLLKRPPAIAFNIDSLNQAEQAGAVTVRVIDLDSGIIYQSTIRHIWEKGVEIDRGYGRQVYLPLNGWIKSMPGSASQLAWAF